MSGIERLRLLLAALTLALVGCGGGGGSAQQQPVPAPAAQSPGDVAVVLRDAEGDFFSYAVDVTSITLRRVDGDVVETVPLATRVDFAELVELTEFFSIATVPAGVYTEMVVGLDFTNAQILAQDESGNAVDLEPVDGSGAALGPLSVRIEMPSGAPIRIAAGIPAHVTVDFDLEASNAIDLVSSPAVVVVEPFLTAIPELEADREHRVRGLLAVVDANAGAVTLEVRPFRHRQSEFGRLRFLTDDETFYEIDGVEYAGRAGLDRLAALAVDTPVIAQGPVQDGLLAADVVLAGSSVPWANADVVHGVVTARTGDVLTVRAARAHHRVGDVSFHDTLEVIVSEDTTVVARRLTDSPVDHNSISVGQRVTVFGERSGSDVFDASAGRVRLNVSTLTGEVRSDLPLVVDLVRLNALRPEVFEFAGTGSGAAFDADPDHYEIDRATLALPTVAAADLVHVRGLVNGFGSAPPDFLATTVIDIDAESGAATLLASWGPGGTREPFVSMSPARLDVDLSDARYRLAVRGVPRPLAGAETIAIEGVDGHGIYAIKRSGAHEIRLYRTFDELVTALAAELDAGRAMVRIHAYGRYNAAADTGAAITTARAAFEFVAP